MTRNTKRVNSGGSKRATKRKSPIDKIVGIEPMKVAEQNLLADVVVNTLSSSLANKVGMEKNDDKPTRCPKGQRRNKNTGECEPIGKKPRQLIEGCNYEYKIEAPEEKVRAEELKKMLITTLRSKLITMLGIEDPKTESVMGARLKPQFINWIVCLEQKRGLLRTNKEDDEKEDDEKK